MGVNFPQGHFCNVSRLLEIRKKINLLKNDTGYKFHDLWSHFNIEKKNISIFNVEKGFLCHPGQYSSLHRQSRAMVEPIKVLNICSWEANLF